MSNRVLSVHQEHELLLKLEQAGLSETDAQAVIESKGNALAKDLVGMVHKVVRGDWFSFTTTASSLKELRNSNLELFYLPSDDWWVDESFANQRRGKAEELHLVTSAVPGSFNQTWNEQRKLISGREFVPTARDLVEGMLAYRQKTGKWLFSDLDVRTADVASHYRIYHVGVSVRSDRIIITNYFNDDRTSELGLVVARRSFEP